MQKQKIHIAVAAAALCAMSGAHAATITHDDGGGFRTIRGAGSAPVGRMTVSASETISGFGVDVDLHGNGNLKFLIFDSTTGGLLYQSAAKSFLDTGGGYKFSDAFSFTFNPGTVYGLTAISDVGEDFLVDFVGNTVGNFNFLTGNQNTTGSFGSPGLDTSTNCCDVATALVTGAAPVPEPETYAMMLAGLGLLGLAARRRKQRAA